MPREYEQSQISFAEYNDPVTDDIAAVLMDRPGGRKAVVAYIREDYDPSGKRKMYTVVDTEGKMIISPCASLSIVKKDILKREQEFHERAALKEQAIGKDFTEEERRRFKELRTMRSDKSKNLFRTR